MATKQMNDVIGVVEWIKDNIQLTKLGADSFGGAFGQRTPGEVLKSKQTNYINTCVDLTFATALLLKEKGFEPIIVAEERVSSATKKPAIHFTLEIQINHELYSLDYLQGKVAKLRKGGFVPDESHLAVKRFPARELSRSTKPLNFLGLKDIAEVNTVFTQVKKEHIDALVERMRRADKTRLFKRIKNTNKRVIVR